MATASDAGSSPGTSWQPNAAGRPCADRAGRTHRPSHRLRCDGTDQGICPCTGTLASGLATVARHPSDVRAVTDRGVPRLPVRSIAQCQRTGPGGWRRRPDRLWPGLTGAPRRLREARSRTGIVGPDRSRHKGGKQAKLPHKKGATPAGGESRGRRTVQVRVRTPEPSSREA